MQKLPAVNFPGVEKANENMLAIAQGLRKQPMHIDIALDNARSQAAGTSLNIQIAGNMFYVDNNPNDGAAIVHFQDQTLNGAAVPFSVAPGFMSRVPYTQIAIENAAQAGKKIRIIYGIDLDFVPSINSQVQASIINTPNVNVANIPSVTPIDTARSRTVAGTSFFGPSYSASPAGQSPVTQLWNPVGSGKTLFVSRLQSASSVALAIVRVITNTGALATLLSTGRNKLIGGAAGVGELRAGTIPVFTADPDVLRFALTASTYSNDFRDPIRISPGNGIYIASETANSTLWTNFEWDEV